MANLGVSYACVCVCICIHIYIYIYIYVYIYVKYVFVCILLKMVTTVGAGMVARRSYDIMNTHVYVTTRMLHLIINDF